jgi:hypothetical protein
LTAKESLRARRKEKTMRDAASKLMWVGRATVFMVGLAVTLALVLGVFTTALASIPGDPFRLGQTNGIDAMSTLVGNVAGTMLRVDNNSTGAGATALELQVEAGKPPMKINSGAKVALLNADKLDGKDATAFYAAGSKVADSSHADTADSATRAADANTLGGKNSSEFAAANHNHDSSYIQQSPTSVENASININGTLQTSGMVRTGSETGTFEGPGVGLSTYEGLVVRRTVSTSMNHGTVIARTNYLTLERDGSMGGLRIAWSSDIHTPHTVACMGLTSTGAPVGFYSGLPGGSRITNSTVFADSQNVVYYSCSFGEPGSVGSVTEVTMTREAGTGTWVGTLTSSMNQ